MSRGAEESKQELRSLILDFLEKHPVPTPALEESLCSEYPGHADHLKKLFDRLRGLSPDESRRQLDQLLVDVTIVQGEPAQQEPGAPRDTEAEPGWEKTMSQASPGKAGDGPLFDGRYRIVRLLGEGGFGRVDLVQDTLRHDEPVALKVILSKLQDKEEFELRFQNEISVLRALRHEGIPQIFNDGRTSDEEFYYTMEFVNGTSLEDVLDKEKSLGPLRIVRLVRQLTNILDYAHSQGVVHRDLKPGNILLVNAGEENEQVKVLDFGIAKILRKEGILEFAKTMNTMAAMGTPHYMSPEQVRGKEVDERTDFYALGVIIYRMVSSRFPFKGKTAMEIATARIEKDPAPLALDKPSEVSTRLATLVKNLLEREKENRPDAKEIRLLLRGIVTEQRRLYRFGRRAMTLVVAAGVVAMAVLGWRSWKSDELPVALGAERAAATESTEGDLREAHGGTPGLTIDPIPEAVGGPLALAGNVLGLELSELLLEWPEGSHPVRIDGDGSFDEEVDLPSGVYDMRIVDPQSRDTLDAIHVVIDRDPPAITFDALPGNPFREDGQAVRYVAGTASITGSAQDGEPGVLRGVRAGSTPLQLDEDGRFSHSLFEEVGPQLLRASITFVASDAAGHEASEPLHFVYDPGPPEIQFELAGKSGRGSARVAVSADEVTATIDVLDDHPDQLFLDGELLDPGEGARYSVPLALGGDPERSFHFRAADRAGREGEATITLSRTLELVALSVNGDEQALERSDLDTPSGTVTISGKLNRPAKSVGISVGEGRPIEASLSGDSFEAEVQLGETGRHGLEIHVDGESTGSWTVNWQPPLAPGGCEALGEERIDGWARHIRHEASGLSFVLVEPPRAPYAFGGLGIEINRPFYCGKTEVTWGQFERSSLAAEQPRFLADAADPSSHPVVNVSFAGAREFCESIALDGARARIPTEAEWLHAAGGMEAPSYSWGNDWDPGSCHSRETSPRINGTVPVLTHAATESWCGAIGFVGNVSEWCTDQDGNPALRGGSWNGNAEDCMLTKRPRLFGEGGKTTVGMRVVLELE